MNPPTKPDDAAPVTQGECSRKHASTTWLLAAVLTATLLVLGFGVTSSIASFNAASGIRDIKEDVREIRKTQIEMLWNGKHE